MEENQAMMSRAELQSMIAQLEEAEQKAYKTTTAEQRAGTKPAVELSGIRTKADLGFRKKTPLSQEDRQLCWRYCLLVVVAFHKGVSQSIEPLKASQKNDVDNCSADKMHNYANYF